MIGNFALIISSGFDVLQNYADGLNKQVIKIGPWQLAFAEISITFHIIGMTLFSLAFWTFSFVNWQTCKEMPNLMFAHGMIETKPKEYLGITKKGYNVIYYTVTALIVLISSFN